MTISIVEDDENIRGIVSYALKSAGYDTLEFDNGETYLAGIDANPSALVILDIMLPGKDGLSILKRLRSLPKTKSLPVIILTAKGSEFDKVTGLNMGADDYIVKPFGVMELISRVGAVLRRGKTETEDILSYEKLSLDVARRAVYVDGAAVALTFKEYELLHYLLKKQGLAQNRGSILEAVWGNDFEGESRTLDMHIKSLRQKLGDAGSYIKTIRNVGYTLGN